VNPGDDILGFREENKEKEKKKQLKGCVFVGTHQRKRKRESVCFGYVVWCGASYGVEMIPMNIRGMAKGFP